MKIETIPQAFEAGFDSHDQPAKNPFYSSSDMGDAFELGRFTRLLGFPRTMATALKKSRGYTWFVGASKFRVDGDAVKLVSSHPVCALSITIFFLSTLACLSDSVTVGRGVKYHALQPAGTNAPVTLCWRRGDFSASTNKVDCKQCLFAVAQKKAK